MTIERTDVDSKNL